MAKKKRKRTPNLAHLDKGCGETDRIRQLRAAILPFASVELPVGSSGTDVYLYIGRRDTHGDDPPLKLHDFIRAREVLGLA